MWLAWLGLGLVLGLMPNLWFVAANADLRAVFRTLVVPLMAITAVVAMSWLEQAGREAGRRRTVRLVLTVAIAVYVVVVPLDVEGYLVAQLDKYRIISDQQIRDCIARRTTRLVVLGNWVTKASKVQYRDLLSRSSCALFSKVGDTEIYLCIQ